jgi:hypothetical protein
VSGTGAKGFAGTIESQEAILVTGLFALPSLSMGSAELAAMRRLAQITIGILAMLGHEFYHLPERIIGDLPSTEISL